MSNLAGSVLGSRTAAFFERTGTDLALGAVVESEPGQEVLRAGVDQVQDANAQLLAWRKQISAWWLLNASYLPTESAPKADSTHE